MRTVLALAAVIALCASATAVVTNSSTNTTYPTIQAAVDAAAPGQTISVGAGTYTEQVTVPAGKNNLTIRSTAGWNAIIKAPPALAAPGAIVRVNGSTNVTIRDFTIAGPSAGFIGPFGLNLYGVRVDGGGSANILGNHITDIRNDPFSGVQGGVGIQVGRMAEGQTGSANIVGNLIDNYQKNGITVDNVGSYGNINNNRIVGVGPTVITAQNGIQISRGADGDVTNNEVLDNLYTPTSFTATGILMFNPGDVTVEGNLVTGNGVGIWAIGQTGGLFRGNEVLTSLYDGIAVQDSTGVTVSKNQTHSGGWGIGLYGAVNCAVSHNKCDDNGFDGIFADVDSSGNNIDKNKMHGNAEHDAHDDSVGAGTAGTANTWTKNNCDTDNRGGGLCHH